MSSPPHSSPLPEEDQIVSLYESMVLNKSAPVSSLNSTTKTPFSFEHLPIDVFRGLLKNLTFMEKRNLRNTSKALRKGIDFLKIDIDYVFIEVNDEEVEFHIDELKCKYVPMDDGCRMVVGDKSREFPKQDAWIMAKKDLRRLLNSPLRIREIFLLSYRRTEFFFHNLVKTLTVHKAEIWTNTIPRVLFLLSKLDPCHLREVNLDCRSKIRIERIFETAHFKMASSWEMVCKEEHLEHFWNFEKFEIGIPSVTLPLVQKVIEKMLANPNLAYCQICAVEHIDLSGIGLALGETENDGKVRLTIPIPGDYRDLKVVLSLGDLEVEKVSNAPEGSNSVPVASNYQNM
ncbi:unnamed protein product [Caenorhabditis nigoni]